MTIPPKTLALWRTLKSTTDFKNIEEKNPGFGKMLFYRAIKNGNCNDDVFKLLSEFYNEKAAKIKAQKDN